MKKKNKKLCKALNLATYKVRSKIIHLLGGHTSDELSKHVANSYNRGKLLGQAEAAIYLKDYMKKLWKDPDWSDKAYKKVSMFIKKDLQEEYRRNKENEDYSK